MHAVDKSSVSYVGKIVQEQLILTLGLPPESWQGQAVHGLCVI